MRARGGLQRVWREQAGTGNHAPRMWALLIGALLVSGLHGTFGIAYADVPTAADIAACNREARGRSGGRAVSPTSRDEAAADAARRADAETVTQSSDPQIHGMDGEGAKNAAYRAAYRSCMRRNGF